MSASCAKEPGRRTRVANPEHVKFVTQGAAVIAEWRKRHQSIRLELGAANLDGADLTDADLGGANLRRADLSHANLSGANLFGADIRRGDLLAANLQHTDLHGAYLSGANLVGTTCWGTSFYGALLGDADLRSADLRGAQFIRANLKGAMLGSAVFGETVFGDADLSETTGLDSAEHRSPSVIDERTLRISWPLPEAFLRGCGLSDEFVRYLPSLFNQPVEFYSCFISYSSKDQQFADRLYAALQNKGVRCWFAPEDMKTGDPMREVIDKAIRMYDKLLLILSKDSVQSPWVQSEVEAAFEREHRQKRRVLFPVRIDDAVMRTRQAWAADVRRTRHIGDFTSWKEHDEYQKAFDRLMRDLKQDEADKPSTT